tara:strand:- start:483 stop:1043 length:561 start_codon:yes stop_codon:yes gene_type:complete
MRIISGFFKGKKIIKPLDKNTRPLKDLTKESIFNLINHSNKFSVKLDDSIVLDLFSGVGSFGIECLSRGAKKVTFIENYLNVLKILKRNLDNLKSNSNYEIIEENIYNDNFKFNFKNKFDIIFIDPPYKNKNLDKLLIKIKNSKILNESGVIIVHRHKSEQDIIPENFKIIEEKKYGISKIIFLNF